MKKVLTILFICSIQVSCRFNRHNEPFNEKVKQSATDTITVKGEILNFVNGYCGVLCTGGMIKVKLDYQPGFLSTDTIYIITACESRLIKKGNIVNVKATKLLPTDTECYYQSFMRIDSFKHEYYKLSEAESRLL